MAVYIDFCDNDIEIFDGYEEHSHQLVEATLDYVDFREDAELSVSFVTDEAMRQINLDTRGVDSTTDVLSFPQYDDIGFEAFEDEPVFIGDVVISYDRLKAQAEEFGHSLLREYSYLLVHSILHLMGYDHMEEEDKKEMREAEESILEKFDLAR